MIYDVCKSNGLYLLLIIFCLLGHGSCKHNDTHGHDKKEKNREIESVYRSCKKETVFKHDDHDRPQLSDYKDLAASIVKCLPKLKKQYSCLEDFSVHREDLEDPYVEDAPMNQGKELWISVDYQRGKEGEKPNPGYEPRKKVPQTIPVFASDGIDLSLLLFTGEYPGAHAKLPDYRIGKLKIRMSLRGSCGERKEELEKAIEEIVQKHKKKFQSAFHVPESK